jgi:hypothetical protein
LKVFQFKFLHDILVNNYWLEKWKIKDSNLWTFCQIEAEDIMHLFWDCPCVQEFWRGFKRWITPLTTQVTKRNICFGVGNEMFSLVIFSAKRYICLLCNFVLSISVLYM